MRYRQLAHEVAMRPSLLLLFGPRRARANPMHGYTPEQPGCHIAGAPQWRLGLAVAGRRGTRSRQCIASAGRRETVPGRCADRVSSPDAFAAVAHAIRRGGEYRLRYGARDCSSTVTRGSQGSDPPVTDRCDSVPIEAHWKVSESQPHTFFRTTPRDRVPMSPETPSRTRRGRRETCKELETAIGRALLRGHPGR